MQQAKTKKNWRYYLRWLLWIFLFQLILANISASIYAYRFTHFYDTPPPSYSSQNFFERTWKLFTGPKYYKLTQEEEPSFPFQNISLKTSDGIRIDGWYSGADSINSCVIFFHGITVNKSYVRNEAARFRQWGYNVLLIDFRGHGRSEGNTSSFGVKETDEVEKAFEYAKSKGNRKIILYGVSLGASVCIKAASEKKIEPFAIIADMPFGSLHDHLKSRARVTGGFPSEPFGMLVTFWIGMERGYNGFKHDVTSYAKDVHCPVLIEWGDKDRFVMKTEVESIYEKLASQNKKLVTYPGVDHQSFLQTDPLNWEREIQSFLQSLN